MRKATRAVSEAQAPAGKPQDPEQRSALVYDLNWNEDSRLAEWRAAVAETKSLPPTLAAAIGLDAWEKIAPLEHGLWLGRLLAAALLGAIADRYFATLIERLGEVRDSQSGAIDRAAEACAASIAADKLVFSFGTGHGSLPALEMFPRTGTIVGFRPIVESTMISFHHVWGDMGARQYRFIHAVDGYGKAILRSHQLDSADTMVLFSHSGVNAVILDIALAAKEKGMAVVAVTSVPHSSVSPSRYSSGRKLFEVADVVIETRASLADASIRIDGLEAPVGANSTSITIAIAHAIVSATAEKLVGRGLQPYVMVNPNTARKEAANAANDRNYDELWRRLKAR